MNFLEVSLICSILSCTLVTGFTLLYAVVIMPGLSKLDDKEFIKAFQVTDGVIQDNQPLFILTWLGSVIPVVGAILSSIISVGLPEAWLIVFVGVVYLLGVQGITLSVHLPLNNHIKKINEIQISMGVNSNFKSFYLALSVLLGLIFYLLVSFFIKAFKSEDIKLKY